MKRQYITRGKYAAQVTTTVTPQERNRVAVNFNIVEGDSAKIARINIVGNKAFSEAQLLSEMQLTTPGWTTWYTKNDQYSKQKLSADLETIRSFYQNRGYLEFNVESTQVSITPDKEDIYITVNITEGEPYTVADVRLAGDLPVSGDELGRLISMRTGEIFQGKGCRRRRRRSATASARRLRVCQCQHRPRDRSREAQAAFVIYVDPGRRVYIRKINISGNTRTRDEIIRREMRQLESAWYDGARIERSKSASGGSAISRTSTSRRPGRRHDRPGRHRVRSPEGHRQPAGRCRLFELGQFVLSGSVSQQNIFGTGNALTAAINTSKVNRTISLLFTRALLDRRRHFAHARGSTEQPIPASLVISQYGSTTLGGAVATACPSAKPTRSTSVCG